MFTLAAEANTGSVMGRTHSAADMCLAAYFIPEDARALLVQPDWVSKQQTAIEYLMVVGRNSARESGKRQT